MNVTLGLVAQVLAAVVLYPWVAGRVSRWLLPHGWGNCLDCGQSLRTHEWIMYTGRRDPGDCAPSGTTGTTTCSTGGRWRNPELREAAVMFWPLVVVGFVAWKALEAARYGGRVLIWLPGRALFCAGAKKRLSVPVSNGWPE